MKIRVFFKNGQGWIDAEVQAENFVNFCAEVHKNPIGFVHREVWVPKENILFLAQETGELELEAHIVKKSTH